MTRATAPLEVGARVLRSGYVGTVRDVDAVTGVTVRLERGEVCVPARELVPLAELVDRAERGGYNRADAARRLEELLSIHSGVNLAVALEFYGYASERRALTAAGVSW